MTKEITKAIILQEMQDKFNLREFESRPFLFDETVVPVYNIEQHLEHWMTIQKSVSIVAGPAAYRFFTIPQREKWTLSRYDVVFMAAGAYKVTGLYIVRVASPTDFMYLDMTLGQTVSYHTELNVPIVLLPGDKIYAYIDDYTSTADLRVYVDYMSEDIR